MKYLTGKFLSITLLLIASSVVTAHAATPIAIPPKTVPQPAVVAPPAANTQAAPKITVPTNQFIPCNPSVATTGTQTPTTTGGIAAVGGLAVNATQGPNYVGPTANITAVANAISVRAKSLTTVITIKPGLVLTKPVMIIIDYSSPAGQLHVNPQPYDRCNGNRDPQNDPISGPVGSPGYAVWGKPRQKNINITLTEDRPGGQPYVYTIPLTVNLDPLFDVTISPLRFTLTTDCDLLGSHEDSEIKFSWTTPTDEYHKKNFDTRKGRLVAINDFAWSRQEVSASANLFWPQWSFYEEDTIGPFGAFIEGFGAPTFKILPSAGGYVGRQIKDAHGQSGCEAKTEFDMTIQLRTYSNL